MQKRYTEKVGFETARLLTIQQQDELIVSKIVKIEQSIDEKKAINKLVGERRDDKLAREMQFDERQDRWAEEYRRDLENQKTEARSISKGKSLQLEELRGIVEDFKGLKSSWRKAKFCPKVVDGGIVLNLYLDEVFTTSLSIDSFKKKVNLEITSNTPSIPTKYEEYVGSLNLKPTTFKAELWFNSPTEDWKDYNISYEKKTDGGKKGGNQYLAIKIVKFDGEASWVKGTDIYAKYKNGFFGVW